MLDLNLIRENPEKVKTGIKKKGYEPKIIDRVLKVMFSLPVFVIYG